MAISVPSVTDTDPFADRRVYPRVQVALPAFLQANGKRLQVQILDLSAGGAKLNCSYSLATGAQVTLNCGTLCCGAVVRWQNDGFTGVSFESALNAREVTALADRSRALTALVNTRGA